MRRGSVQGDSVLVVAVLASGTKRFGELHRAIPSLSEKLLTKVVRALEADGLISRKVFHQVPPRVEYSLTPLGRSLKGPLLRLTDWAIQHTDELLNLRPSA